MEFNAKDGKCICGKKGKFLNLWCKEHNSDYFCLKCRDKAFKKRNGE